MAIRLIHYHIFKNAGTSWEHALNGQFGKAYRKYDGPAGYSGLLEKDDLARYFHNHLEVLALSSHIACLPPPKISGHTVITSILLRNPLLRIYSSYFFEKNQDAPTPGAINAKRYDFKGYINWRKRHSPFAIFNFQTNFCVSEGGERAPYELVPALYEKAIENLEQVSIVGTVEQYGKSLQMLENVLGKYLPTVHLAQAVLNVTSPASTEKRLAEMSELLGESLMAELTEKNQVDMQLHEYAHSRLTVRS